MTKKEIQGDRKENAAKSSEENLMKKKKKIHQRELESLIRQEFAKNSLEGATKEETERAVEFLKTQSRAIKREPRCSFLRLIGVQMRLGGGKIWLFQGGILLLYWGLIKGMYQNQMEAVLIRHLPFFVTSIGLLLVMLSIPWIYRSIHYKMLETESASRFSLGNLILARLLILGIGDGIILTAVLGGFSISSKLSIQEIFVWGIWAFLAGAVVLTGLIARGFLNQLYLFYGSFCLIFWAVLWGMKTAAPQLTEQMFLSGFSLGEILCLMLGGLLCMELRRIKRGVTIWNYKLIRL